MCEVFHEQFLKTEKANKVVYERLVRIKKQCPTRSQEKWSKDCELGSWFTDFLSIVPK